MANGSIGVQQSFPDPIQGRTASKDHVVAILRLRQKQPLINPSRAALPRCKKGDPLGKPLPTAAFKIIGVERIGELLQSFGIGALRKGIGGLPKADTFPAPVLCKPVMLIQT